MDIEQCSKSSLDELINIVAEAQADLIQLSRQQPEDTLAFRFIDALAEVAENTILLISVQHQSEKKYQYLEFILRSVCRLFYWFNQSTVLFPSFAMPLDGRITNKKITPSQYFWMMATYEIKTPIDAISSFCILLAKEGTTGTRFLQLHSGANALQQLVTEIFSYGKS